MHFKQLLRRAAILSMTATVSFQYLSSAAPTADSLSLKTASLLKAGKLQEAIDAANVAETEQPRNWLPHAMLSFLHWQEGNAPDAIEEGQKSVRYAPHNATALINLGDIYQDLANYQDALPLYEEARNVDPENWIPWICAARCYIGANRLDDGLKTLHEMSLRNSNNFAWHFQLGETYLIIDKPDLAVEPLSKAVKCATMPEQKSAALADLLVALVRDKQLDRAITIKEESIWKNPPKSSEAYVRAAAALVAPANPAQGKQLLEIASDNLEHTADSEAFFRLGRIFEDKADATGADTTLRDAWLANAESAFRRAIELSSGPSKNHVALAAILERKGNSSEAAQELLKASKFDTFDPLGPFLSSRFCSAKNADAKGTQKPNVVAVDFEANGLTCGCHATRIDAALRASENIATVRFSHIAPYKGTILIDQSATTVEKELTQCEQQIFPASPAMKDPPHIKLAVLSQKPVQTIDEAVKLAQSTQYGSILDFQRKFDAILPEMPVSKIADHSGTSL